MANSVTFMDWVVELVEGEGTVERALSEIDAVPAGTAFSVSGTMTASGYLYLVEVSDARVAVLHPVDDTPDREEAGAELRLPGNGARFAAPMDGELRLFSSPIAMGPADWIALFPGREPHPKKAGGKNTII